MSLWDQSNEKSLKIDNQIIKGKPSNYGPDSEKLVGQQTF